MGKTSAAVKNRYNAKAYDRIGLIVPKGRKATIKARSEALGEKSVNSYVERLIRADLGLSEADWKRGEEGQG